MERQARWARAKRETHDLKDWHRGIRASVITGLGSAGALLAFGSRDALTEELVVVAGALVAGFVLRPLLELTWNYIWAPWRDLNERVLAAPAEDSPARTKEKLFLVLRDFARQGRELDAMRTGGQSYNSRELDELEDWTADVFKVLFEYADKEHAQQFIDATRDIPNAFAVHRQWARVRVQTLEAIIADLGSEPSDVPP